MSEQDPEDPDKSKLETDTAKITVPVIEDESDDKDTDDAEKKAADEASRQDAQANETSEDDIDLTGEAPLETSLVYVRKAPFDVVRARENARRYLALLLGWLLVGVVALSFFTLWASNVSIDELKSLLELIFAPIIALVASATGFYFGGKTD